MKTRPAVHVHIATPADAKEVAAIIKRHSETDYMGYVTFTDKYIKDKMKKNNFYFIATNKDGDVIGCIRASIVDLDLAEIRTVCVDKEYQGKGIASELMKIALEFLKKKKMRKVAVRCKADNKASMAIFTKFGFEKEGYFKEHYRKGIDVVQYGKFL